MSRAPLRRSAWPLIVTFQGGRVAHYARLLGGGPAVTAACGRRGLLGADAAAVTCRACADLPWAQDQRTYPGP